MRRNQYLTRKCKICGREYHVVKPNGSYHKRGSGVRRRGSKTCNKECSRIYQRQQQDLYWRKYRKEKKIDNNTNNTTKTKIIQPTPLTTPKTPITQSITEQYNQT